MKKLDLSYSYVMKKTAGLTCPTCGGALNNASGGPTAPTPENTITVSICCNEILLFKKGPEGLHLEKLSDAEFASLPAGVQDQLNIIRESLKRVKARKPIQ